MQVGTISEFEPKPARNGQQKDDSPADCERYGNRRKKREPLPEWHPQKHVAYEPLREFVFDLVGFDVVVQFGDFAERVRGKEPALPPAWIRDPHEHDGNILIARGKSTDGLLFRGAVFGIAIGTVEPSRVTHIGAVHQYFQLAHQVGPLRL